MNSSKLRNRKTKKKQKNKNNFCKNLSQKIQRNYFSKNYFKGSNGE